MADKGGEGKGAQGGASNRTPVSKEEIKQATAQSKDGKAKIQKDGSVDKSG